MVVLCVTLEVVAEMRLTEEDAVAVPVRAAELLRVLVRVRVPTQLLVTIKTPVAAL